MSNVLQYLEYFCRDEKLFFKFLRESFEEWVSLLNDDGILQLLYLYSYDYQSIFKEDYTIFVYNLKNVYKALLGYSLNIDWIDGVSNRDKDAIVTYIKKR